VGTGLVVVMGGVTVSVLSWLSLSRFALSYIGWRIRTGKGERLFRRRGF
jgi:SOS response regulatory protein OraA/RecX